MQGWEEAAKQKSCGHTCAWRRCVKYASRCLEILKTSRLLRSSPKQPSCRQEPGKAPVAQALDLPNLLQCFFCTAGPANTIDSVHVAFTAPIQQTRYQNKFPLIKVLRRHTDRKELYVSSPASLFRTDSEMVSSFNRLRRYRDLCDQQWLLWFSQFCVWHRRLQYRATQSSGMRFWS